MAPCTAHTSAGALAPAQLSSEACCTDQGPQTAHTLVHSTLHTSTRSAISSQLVLHGCGCTGSWRAHAVRFMGGVSFITAAQKLPRYRRCTAACTGSLQLVSSTAFAAVLHIGPGSSVWLLRYCRNCERVTCSQLWLGPLHTAYAALDAVMLARSGVNTHSCSCVMSATEAAHS